MMELLTEQRSQLYSFLISIRAKYSLCNSVLKHLQHVLFAYGQKVTIPVYPGIELNTTSSEELEGQVRLDFLPTGINI
jgi:xanthine/uracil permease